MWWWRRWWWRRWWWGRWWWRRWWWGCSSSGFCGGGGGCTCCCISITVATEKLISSITEDNTVIWTNWNPIDCKRPLMYRVCTIITGRWATPWSLEVIFAAFACIFVSWTVRIICELKYMWKKLICMTVFFWDNWTQKLFDYNWNGISYSCLQITKSSDVLLCSLSHRKIQYHLLR